MSTKKYPSLGSPSSFRENTDEIYSDIKWIKGEDMPFQISPRPHIHQNRSDTISMVLPTHYNQWQLSQSGVYHHDGSNGNHILDFKALIKYTQFNEQLKFDHDKISSVIDVETKQLWIVDDRSMLHHMNYTNPASPKRSSHKIKNDDSMQLGLNIMGDTPMVIDFNHDIHCIGGSGSSSHFIMDETKKGKFKWMHKFYDIDGWTKFGMLTMKKGKKILLLGGLSGSINIGQYYDDIHLYDVSTKTWTISDLKLPVKLAAFGCGVIYDRYIFIMGGFEANGVGNPRVFMCDWVKQQWIDLKENLNVPQIGCYHMAICDKRKEEEAVTGFIRSVVTENNMKQIPLVLHQKVKELQKDPVVHIFLASTHKQWHISVKDLFKQLCIS